MSVVTIGTGWESIETSKSEILFLCELLRSDKINVERFLEEIKKILQRKT